MKSAGIWLLLAAGVSLRIACYSGATAFDEFVYAKAARATVAGNFSMPDSSEWVSHWYVRPAVTAPAAVAFKIGLPARAACAWFPFLCGVLSIYLVYRIGLMLHGSAAALLAAAFICVFPMDLVYSTILYPEMIVQAFTLLAFLAFLKASGFPRQDGPADARPEWIFGMSAGALLWVAGLARTTAFFGALVFIVFGLIRKKWRPVIAAASAVVALLVFEGIVYLFMAGDFFYRMHAEKVAVDIALQEWSYSYTIYPEGLFGGNMYGLGMFGLFPLAFLACAALLAVRRRLPEIRFEAAWWAVFFLLIEFIPGQIYPYKPLMRQLRFLSALTAPTVLGLAAALVVLGGDCRPGMRRIFTWAAPAFLVAAGIFAGWSMRRYRHAEFAPYMAAVERARIGVPWPDNLNDPTGQLVKEFFVGEFRNQKPLP